MAVVPSGTSASSRPRPATSTSARRVRRAPARLWPRAPSTSHLPALMMRPIVLIVVALLGVSMTGASAQGEPNQGQHVSQAANSGTGAVGQNVDPEELTDGWPNGRFWNTLDLQSKIWFLYGIESGVGLAGSATHEDARSLLSEFGVKGFRFSDVAAEVDAFYRERANIRVPVAFAYHYVVKKMKGASPDELNTFAAQLRKAAH